LAFAFPGLLARAVLAARKADALIAVTTFPAETAPGKHDTKPGNYKPRLMQCIDSLPFIERMQFSLQSFIPSFHSLAFAWAVTITLGFAAARQAHSCKEKQPLKS